MLQLQQISVHGELYESTRLLIKVDLPTPLGPPMPTKITCRSPIVALSPLPGLVTKTELEELASMAAPDELLAASGLAVMTDVYSASLEIVVASPGKLTGTAL